MQYTPALLTFGLASAVASTMLLFMAHVCDISNGAQSPSALFKCSAIFNCDSDCNGYLYAGAERTEDTCVSRWCSSVWDTCCSRSSVVLAAKSETILNTIFANIVLFAIAAGICDLDIIAECRHGMFEIINQAFGLLFIRSLAPWSPDILRMNIKP